MPTNYDRAAIEINTTYSTSVSYSTLSLLDFIEQKDQLEVYRKDIESRWETVNTPSTLTLTREERNSFGLVKPEWITVDTTTKTITGITIPVDATFTRENGSLLTYPEMAVGEAIRIKRKTINSETLVEWVNGSRITADQLNLLATQMIGNGQENLHELENNVVKLEDAGVTFATPEYVDEQIDSIQNSISVPNSISDATDHNRSLIYLVRDTGLEKNIPNVLENIEWNNINNTLTCYLVGQTQPFNIFQITTNTGTLLNYFNGRGVLNQAGRIYYGSTTPSPQPNAADTGLLWWDTSVPMLRVWSGSAWVSVPAGSDTVTALTTQTISGQKTFTAPATYIGVAGTQDSGKELFTKSIIVRPELEGSSNSYIKAYRNAATAQTLSLTTWTGTTYKVCANISPTDFQITDGTAFGCTSLNANAKAVICSLADPQTITGQKTFAANATYFGNGTSNAAFIENRGLCILNRRPQPDGTGGIHWGRYIAHNTNDWSNQTGLTGTIIANNFAAGVGFIQLIPDGYDKDNIDRAGINIRARNPQENGRLNIYGDTVFYGDIYMANGRKIRQTDYIRHKTPYTKIIFNGAAGQDNYLVEGAFELPGATLTRTPSGTNFVLRIQNYAPDRVQQVYRITAYNGGPKVGFNSYTMNWTKSTNTTTNPASPANPYVGSMVVYFPANQTNWFELTVTKATGTNLVDNPYIIVAVEDGYGGSPNI